MGVKSGNFQVLIVGCGDLGCRHLQAVAFLPSVREVEIVDPRPEALMLGQKRLAEVPDSMALLFRGGKLSVLLPT